MARLAGEVLDPIARRDEGCYDSFVVIYDETYLLRASEARKYLQLEQRCRTKVSPCGSGLLGMGANLAYRCDWDELT